MSQIINFPSINGVDGATCEIYSYGFTAGCTDENGIDRGFTQDWYYNGTVGAWMSATENYDSRRRVTSHLAINASIFAGVTEDISFSDSNIHYVTFSGSSGVVNLNVIDCPNDGYYDELTLIIENAAAPSTLNITGNNGTSVVRTDLPGLDTFVSGKLYMFKLWTIDSGDTIYVYRVNGYGRYWNP